ncbi:MAG: N-acetylneuraminate synthase family protein [Prochlorococcus marinus CUG1437]|nr:N-acetylneuraminate synthase family protein [Prochlorococcus marinus CUG1437]
MKAIILGAGPSGTSLAWFLSQKSWEVDLIEMKDKVGGLARSSTIKYKDNNIILDSGPHIFHTSDSEMIKIWKSSFKDLLDERELFSANAKGEKYNEFHDYPISKEGLKKRGLELLRDEKKNHFLHNNYRDYMKSRVGEKIEKQYFRNYPEKLWGISTKNMKADWAPKRIEIREKILPFFYGQWCATSNEGSGAIYEKIICQFKNKGGRVHLNNKIEKLIHSNGKISSIITEKSNINIDGKTLIISSLPTIQLGRLLGIKEKSNYRGVAIVSVCHSTNTFPEKFSWIYFDDPKIAFTRVTNFSELSPNAVNGKVVYMYEVPFDSNAQIDEEDVINRVKKSISLIPWLKISFHEVINIQLERYVYPIREDGFEYLNSKINGIADSFENLRRSGTAAEFEYGDVQICFRKSLDMANDLTKEFHDSNQNATHVSIKNSHNNNAHTLLSENHKKVFIAEIGINHNGSLDMAKKLIETAKLANADFVKFQLYKSETRANKFTRDAFYQEESDGEGENLYQVFKRCELKFHEMQELYIYSDKLGIPLFFSAFDRETVKQAFKISPELIKISSMDLSNFEVCDQASKLYKNIIMSTGMSTFEDIKKSSQLIQSRIGDNLTLLHCISSYPMNLMNISLGTISELKKYSSKVGYSDHSMDPFSSLLAASMGAEVIEKHITLDKKLPGPDHVHSLCPEELKNLVDKLHNFPIMMKVRDGIAGVENKEYRRQKKGYFYKNDMPKGAILRCDDLLLMPPCIGSDTFEVNEMIGKKLKFNKLKLEPVKTSDYLE